MSLREQLEFFSSGDKKSQGRKEFVISIERLLIISVFLLILFVVIYVLGIKKGEQIAVSRLDKAIREERVLSDTHKYEAINDTTNVEVSFAEQKDAIKKDQQFQEKGYIIQVASYKKDRFLERENKYLKTQGYEPLVKKKGKYFVLYVGPFKSLKEAKLELKKLKQRYKDCYIRRWK